MGKIYSRFIYFFSFLSLILTAKSFAEGTKELMPDSANSQNAFILIANGFVGGNQRDPFALYNGNADYRLFIHISNHVTEKIYFGLGAVSGGGSSHLADPQTGWRPSMEWNHPKCSRTARLHPVLQSGLRRTYQAGSDERISRPDLRSIGERGFFYDFPGLKRKFEILSKV